MDQQTLSADEQNLDDSSYESDENLFDDMMNLANSVEQSLSLVDNSINESKNFEENISSEPLKGDNLDNTKITSSNDLEISDKYNSCNDVEKSFQQETYKGSDSLLSAEENSSESSEATAEDDNECSPQNESEVTSNASSTELGLADPDNCCTTSELSYNKQDSIHRDCGTAISSIHSSPSSSISSTTSEEKQRLYRLLSMEKESRVPIHSGYLMKLGGTGFTPKNWRKRWFVLRSDNCLYYYKSPEGKPAGGIVLSNYLVTSVLGNSSKNYAFQLTKGGARTYTLAAFSDTEMRTWMQIISESAKSDDKVQTSPEYSIHNISIPALSIKDPDCHGYIWKQGQIHKSWKRRYAVLKDGSLFYYKDMSQTTAIGVFCLHCYTVIETESCSRKFGIVAIPPQPTMRTYYFATETENDRERWVKALKDSIELADCK